MPELTIKYPGKLLTTERHEITELEADAIKRLLGRISYRATVTILLTPGLAESEGGAADAFSVLLSENPYILDWAYVETPTLTKVASDYKEGDFLNQKEG